MNELANFWNIIVESNTFNFAVLLLIFAILYKKLNISNTVEKIKQDIINTINNAKTEKENAKNKLMEAEKSIEHIDEEIKQKLSEASIKGDDIAKQILANTNEKVDLIEKNILRYPKTLMATKPHGPRPLYFHAQSEKEEADWIAEEIKKLINSGTALDRIAVLYRSHFLSRSLEESFSRHTLAYKIYSGTEFYSRAEIKDCVAYLRMLTAADDVAFLRTINSPSRKIGKKKLQYLKDVAAQEHISLFEALKRTVNQDIFKGTGARKYVYAIETVTRDKHSHPLGTVLQKILDLSGYENYLRLQSDQERLDNVAELKRAVQQAGEDPDTTLEDFLAKVALLTNMDGKDKRQAIKLMTIHSAKGMEFSYVFICGLNEGVFPSRNSEGVANDNAFKLPSRFIFDIGREYLDYVRELPQSFEGRVKRLSTIQTATSFQVGDLVSHPVFGLGRILEVNTKAGSYKIQFEKLQTERDIQFRAPLTRA